MFVRLLVLLALAVSARASAQAPVSLADALGAARQQSPEVALAGEAIAGERANLRAAASAFDPQLYGSVGGGQAATPNRSFQGTTPVLATAGSGYQQVEVGVQRQYRSGLALTPLVQMTRTAADGTSALLETTAGVSLAYPVLGGRERNTALAAEDAAGQRISAARADLDRAAETAAAAAAVAYWDYVGAVRIQEALQVAEARAARLLADTEALVAADERPAADLVALRADISRRRAARLSADQSVYDARQRLGLAMGGTAADADALGPAADALPEVPATVEVDEAALVARALDARADLLGADLRVRALDRETAAATADLRPSVDVVLDAGYTTLSEGAAAQFLPVGGASRGGRVGVSLRVNRLGSGITRATTERQRATRERLRIARDDLARRIRADVAGAVASLRSGAAEVAQTREAVALYQEAVENERLRLRLGMGTLFDVQIVEERLANARTSAVQAEVRYAQALVRLHAAVGALGPAADLCTLPAAP